SRGRPTGTSPITASSTTPTSSRSSTGSAIAAGSAPSTGRAQAPAPGSAGPSGTGSGSGIVRAGDLGGDIAGGNLHMSEAPVTTTLIRNAAWLIAWDAANKQHVYLRDTDIAFRGGEIVHVGPGFAGKADRVIDGSKRLVMPGLINVHTHPTSEPLRKGITDETISPGFWHSSLYEFLTVFNTDDAGAKACMQVALAELLTSGVTTVTDLSVPFDGWLDTLAESGIRACIAPMFRDARWHTDDGHLLKYEWNTANGRKGFENAQRLIELARQHPSGRLMGMVCPSQVDTCTPELLRDAHDFAKERNLPYQIHASQ